MTESDHADQPRPARRHFFRDRLRPKTFGFRVDDLHRVAAVARIAGDQPAPKRRLDCGQFLAKFLIYTIPPIGINEQQVQIGSSWRPPRPRQ